MTIIMEGLRTGVARTEVFRVHPSTFEEAVSIISSRPDLAGMGTTLALREQTPRVLRSVIGRNRWISAMLKTEVKLNFKLLSSNVLYDGVIRVESLNTCGLVAFT